MIPNLCIFTPTYNRAYKLPDLYESLCMQDSSDFYWLVVDDGSTDNTTDLIEGWKSEHRIEIEYIRVKNGGKQRACDFGVQRAVSPLFMCVDSDDCLLPSAVSQLLGAWEDAKEDARVAGIVTPQAAKNEKFPPSGSMPLSRLYSDFGYCGETCIMERTDVLRRFHYDVAEDEKFIPELYVFDQIDREYVHVCLPEELCVGEYLEDGYSRNYGNLLLSNPKSYARYKLQCLNFASTWLSRCKEAILYLVWCRISGLPFSDALRNGSHPLLLCAVFVPSRLAYHVVRASLAKI